MLFNSVPFAGLVLVTFAAYYLLPQRKLQPLVLIIASFYFYASSAPPLLLVLVTCIVTNILFSHRIAGRSAGGKISPVVAGVAVNLAFLAFFKYSPLAGKVLGGDGGFGAFLMMIPLPVGISFYTFQGVTLIVDTLRIREKRLQPIFDGRSFARRALDITHYLSFFPQLVAGPIVKAHDFIPQITPKSFSNIDWNYCFRHTVAGYFFKMVVADNLREYTSWIEYPFFINKSTPDLIGILFGYSMQIYADFAGYSLIAIGIAGLFGYRLPENFNAPYIAASFSEFWGRWHMSLSSFLREYLYFSLGGNRRGSVRTYLNIMLVMLLGGFWHGAAWSYMVWGGAHGLALVTERFFRERLSVPSHPLVRALRRLTVFSFVSFAWLLFKLPDFSHVIAFFKAMTLNMGIHPRIDHLMGLALFSIPVVLHHGWRLFRGRIPDLPALRLEPAVYGVMLFLILTNSGNPEAFIYFQF